MRLLLFGLLLLSGCFSKNESQSSTDSCQFVLPSGHFCEVRTKIRHQEHLGVMYWYIDTDIEVNKLPAGSYLILDGKESFDGDKFHSRIAKRDQPVKTYCKLVVKCNDEVLTVAWIGVWK